MKTIFVKNYDEMSDVTYDIIKKVLDDKSDAVISMTTGGTPAGVIDLMVDGINNGDLDISKATIMNLDEYVGPKNDPYTVYRFMHDHFYGKINVQPENIFLMDGATEDFEAEIDRYKSILNEYPRDVQVVGLGVNGHIGANEPGTPFDSTIFLADHDDSTINSTMKQYNLTREEAPDSMITLGFTEILEAEKVILMVSGIHKAEAIKNIIEGDITTEWPASYLRDKSNVILVVDEDAASLLSK